ncbi:MAG: ABC transporter substrate-binding protein [bacterium]|nr:ABC transporter substrate-binding protein [bacterium]MCM1376381.1 ABC transporter substrate-binding protein [Muribaculum sp.]
MRRKRLGTMLCVWLLTLGLFVGCGASQGDTSVVSGESSGIQGAVESPGEGSAESPEVVREPVDWKKGGYQMPQYPIGARDCTCVNTYLLDIPEPEFDYIEEGFPQYTSLGSDFYLLNSYEIGVAQDGLSQSRYQLYHLDGDTGESSIIPLFWEEWGEGQWIYKIDAVSDHQLAILSQTEENRTKVTLWDLESGETDIWDMTEAYETLGVHEYWMDAQGYVYASGWPEAALYVLGEKDTPGQLELLRTIEVEEAGTLGLACRMPDGTPLVHMDGKLIWLDMEAGEEKELASISGFTFNEGYIDEEGMFYQNWGNQINVWDPAIDEYNFMVNLKDYGLKAASQRSLRIGVNRANELMMLVEKDGQLMIYCFGEGTETEEATLRLANLWYNDSDVKSAAISYSAEHPDCQIAYETDWANQEGFYERIMAQMAVGQGPDLLFVHGEDMDRLSARGLLADLSDALEEDTRRQLFAGVTTAGIRNGRLVGLPASVSGISMVTVDGNWQEDAWNYAQVVELWQRRRGQGAWRFLPQRWSQEDMLNYLILYNLVDSPFVDWGNGTCDFDNDLFRQMLEMIGEHAVREHTNLELEEEYETARQVMDGVYLADVVYSMELPVYVSIMEYYGGNARLVGLPTESGNGNILNCYGFIVVNAQTEHWEEAVDFLRHMYSKEFQSANPKYLLRKDVLRENMEPATESDKSHETFTLTGTVVPLKEDGSSYVEDYIDFLDSCRAKNRSTEDVENIIREETSGYFQNIQNLDNTVRAIQNRVQLYLNENQP